MCFTWELKALYWREGSSDQYNIFLSLFKRLNWLGKAQRLRGRRHLKAASPCLVPASAEGAGRFTNDEKICEISQFFQDQQLDV